MGCPTQRPCLLGAAVPSAQGQQAPPWQARPGRLRFVPGRCSNLQRLACTAANTLLAQQRLKLLIPPSQPNPCVSPSAGGQGI